MTYVKVVANKRMEKCTYGQTDRPKTISPQSIDAGA